MLRSIDLFSGVGGITLCTITQLHPNIKTPVKFRTWATPAHSQVYAQLVMTQRSIHTLATQVRFERKTKNREGVLAPRFVEWMMGYT
jgi:hypothetical protein